MIDPNDLDEPEELTDEPNVRGGGGLLHFIKRAFRVFTEISLWLIPIGYAVFGGITAKGMDSDYVFYGILIGLVIGILIDIICGGIIATLLAIEKNTAKTEENTAEILSFLKRDAKVVGGKVAGSSEAADFEFK
jgi:hypothetical protein